MNKSYRLIWSKVKEAWVIVSETVKGAGGPTPATVRGLLTTALLAASAGAASALPTGPNVISGTAGINTVGGTMTISNSANAIINWQGFSIGQGETARFIQPSALSAVLNRVTGGDPSKILGALQSNGKVLLINPNGILFGPNARVDVNGLVASTLNITNEDFLAGKMKFSAGPLAGKVENQGAITTPGGGQVYLIAPDVTNSGIITAPNGDVLLAAGKEVLLVDKSSPEIAVVVAVPADQSLNLGSIVADAGRVGMYGSVVRQKGRISADSAVRDASGRIFLKATREATVDRASITSANGPKGGSVTVQATDGTTLVSGAIEAKSSQGIGGDVQILGQQAGLIDTAVVDVSGGNGGGSVLVGGDYQGRNPAIQNARAAYMGRDATIKADATDNGTGGKVIIWADDTTRYYGNIFARGGVNSGDGGFAEVSGKNSLHFAGNVNAMAPKGRLGTLLLDPQNIVVQTGGSAAYADVEIFASQPGTTQTIAPATLDSLAAAVTLQATNNITFTDALTLATAAAGLTAEAGNDILVNNVIRTSGGAVSLTANSNAGGTATGNGRIVVGSGGSIDTTNSGGVAAGADISLHGLRANTGDYGIALAGSLNAGTGGTVQLDSVGNHSGINQTGGIITGNVLSIAANSPVSLTQPNMVSQLSGGIGNGPSATAFAFTNGTALTTGALSFNGDATISAPSLTIDGDVSTYRPGDISFAATAGVLNFNAGRTINFDKIGNLPAKTLTLSATGNIVSNGTISDSDTAGDRLNVVISGAGSVQIGGPITTGTDVLGAGSVNITGQSVTFTAAGDISAGTTGAVAIASQGTNANTSIVSGTAISGSDVTIKSDKLDLVGTISAANAATITRYNNNVEVQVGGAGSDSDGYLNINSTELGNISAATYRFGDTTSTGGLRLTGAVTMPSGKTLSLLTSNIGGSQIVQNAGAVITADYLRAEGTYVTLNTEENAVTSLAGKAQADFQFKNAGNLGVATVDGQSGINAGANVVLTSITGALSQSSPITAASLTASAYGGISFGSSNSVASFSADNSMANTISYNNSGALDLGNISNGNRAVALTTGGALSQTGVITAGTLSVATVGGAVLNNANSVSGFDATNSSSGTISLNNTAAALVITGISQAGSGTVAVSNDNSISSAGAITLAGGPATLTASGATSDITVGGVIAKTTGADSSLTLKAGRAIVVSQPISSSAGKLDVTLNARYPDSAVSGSVWVNSNISTNGGNLVIGGGDNPSATSAIGYGTASQAERYGVYVQNSTISTAGGNISIRGQGNATSGGDADGINLQAAQLQAGGGNITLTGKSGDTPSSATAGIYSDATIGTTGTGSISLTGIGGDGTVNNIRGVNLISGAVQVQNGALSITGYGGDSSGTGNHGVWLDGASVGVPLQISSTGTGTISITGGPCQSGCANTPTNSNAGILTNDQYVSISGAGGSITLTGTGTGSTTANYGVYLLGGNITNTTANGSGSVSITGNGAGSTPISGIVQTAGSSIQAPVLSTNSSKGTTLSGTANAISSYSALNSTSGDITFNNTAANLMLNGSNINNTGGGDIAITNAGALTSVGWVQTTGNGSISLTATGGSATIGNSLITGNNNSSTGGISVTATGATSDIELNNINVYSGSTGGGSGALAMTAGRDIKLNPAALTTTGNVLLQAGQNVLVNGPISSGSVSINAAAGGAISGTGLISSPVIGLQSSGGTSTVGMVGTPLLTSGNSTISVGNATGPGVVSVSHTGNATINPVVLNTNSPFSFQSTGDLFINSTINTGTADLKLAVGTGKAITVGSTFSLLGQTVGLKGDRIDLSLASAIGSGAGTVSLAPVTAGRQIWVAETADHTGTAAALEFTPGELAKVTGAVGSTLILGDAFGLSNSGTIFLKNNLTDLSRPNANLVLATSGSVLQNAATPGKIVSAATGIRASSVVLDLAPNNLGMVAADLGSGTNPNIKIDNSANLIIGGFAAIPGYMPSVSGISGTMSGGYNPVSPDGFASIVANGSISQTANGLINMKAIRATGTTVALTELNGTGVIAGGATGGSFQYTSSNGISVTTVAGASGIQNTGIGGNITLTGNGIGQDAPLSTKDTAGGGGFGLSLTSTGNVMLQNAGNNVSKISADLSGGTGLLSFKNSGNLIVDGPVTTSGNYINMEVPSAASITVSGTVSAGTGVNAGLKLTGGGITYAPGGVTNNEEISLRSTDSIQGITLSGGVLGTSNTKGIELITDKLTLSGGTAMVGNVPGNSINISTFTAGRGIYINATDDGGALYITNTSTGTFSAPDFGIGSVDANFGRVISGAIAVNAAISRPAGRVGLFTGAGVTQSAPITADVLGVIAGGAVNLSAANLVGSLGIETSTGAIDFANNSAFSIGSITGGYDDPKTITGVKSIGGGNITLSASAGSIGLGAPVSTLTGGVTISAAGAITDASAGAIPTHVKAPAFTAVAASGIGSSLYPIKTAVSTLSATASSSGDIAITNNTAAYPGALTIATLLGNAAGGIIFDNYGPITTVGSIQAGNDITIHAHSPLTIGSGGVSSTSGTILLVAGATGEGVTTDNLTINGPVTTSGSIQLSAGNSILGTNVPTGGNVSKTSNLNPAAPFQPPQTPTIADCTTNPTLSGCSAVLPTLATCTTTPTAPGCTAVLPSIGICTTTPTAPGCTAVLPSMATCTTTPTAPGCTAVLPTLATCTTTPTAPGCTAVLPSIAICTTTPTAPGCIAVLPTLATCTTTPTAPGCTAVLPSITTCTTTPTAPGCTAVLPGIAICTTTPTAPGCTAVLPTLATCTTTPTAPGCTAVLPSITTCTTTPTAPGCTAVLPSIAICTTTPTAPGCTAVLPTLATCTTTPTAPGCTAVLPSIGVCTTTPTAPGCTAVLPTLATCTTNPGAPGCSAVLPTLATCTTTPAAPGCGSVLPSIDTCTTNPGTPGCTAVLPTIATCTISPTAPGCSAVLPKVADCTSNPSLPGCAAVLPVQEQKPVIQANNQIVKDIEQTQTTPVAPAGLQLVSLTPKQDETPPPPAATDNKPQGGSDGSASGGTTGNKKDAEEKDKDKDKKKDAQEQKPAGGDKKDEKTKKNYCN